MQTLRKSTSEHMKWGLFVLILVSMLLVIPDCQVHAAEANSATKTNSFVPRAEKVLGEDFIEKQPAMKYTEEDLYLLATVIFAEAGICDEMEKYRVGNVVLNRVNDETNEFKDTIKGVIYQNGQFASVGTSNWYHGPTEEELKIAEDLLGGTRVFPSNVVWFSKKHQYGKLYYQSEWHDYSGWESEEEE